MADSRILELSKLINTSVNDVHAYLKEAKKPMPSFDEDGPPDLALESPDAKEQMETAASACLELHDLLIGPALTLRPIYNATSLQVIYKHDIPSKVPLGGEISFPDLAQSCNLPEADLRRLLRYAMAHHHVFREKRAGFVAHSAASRYLVEDPHALLTMGYMYDEMWQSYAHTAEAMERFKNSSEPNETGWAIANKTSDTVYKHYKEHPAQAKRFHAAMASLKKGTGQAPLPLINGFDWAALASQSTVVDVGGSNGHMSVALAHAYPDLHFVVQDLPGVIDAAKGTAPAEFADRIEFAVHDFFTPQPVAAAVYLFAWIMHNWSDAYCIRILQALRPALKQGAKVLCYEYVLPEPGAMPLLQEREVRAMDLNMLTIFNAREREPADWAQLFEKADPRFRDVRTWTPAGGWVGLVEATWSG